MLIKNMYASLLCGILFFSWTVCCGDWDRSPFQREFEEWPAKIHQIVQKRSSGRLIVFHNQPENFIFTAPNQLNLYLMTYDIKHAERQSRGELLLRTFFGFIYMYLPHAFILLFLGLWSGILGFISFWIILFTGRYPQSFFEYQVKLIRWQARVSARQLNLVDGYPAFGLDSVDPQVTVEIPYPERLSRGMLLVKLFFGFFYVLLPHAFVLLFLSIGVYVVLFIGWWIILFTGQLPVGMHNFLVGFLRWNQRVNLYISNMTDEYPPFSLS